MIINFYSQDREGRRTWLPLVSVSLAIVDCRDARANKMTAGTPKRACRFCLKPVFHGFLPGQDVVKEAGLARFFHLHFFGSAG
ncbi:hypothetical protein MTAT_07640 [Moorella thermoacetica]|uniref:Uncharacterized protein n=1 Tax=Neomoorella thermoacetica TaxID=1525 RepID=A0AAC9HIA0_NEOTH|nr:hypothetical protein Maut_01686 [Moorella thermoacetica]TYL14529.1 hypothetical protein MTAT_07640 [Moorella thermoacetica]